jgi:hypothetical protein
MRDVRYEEPVQALPDVELIPSYLWSADPKNGASETERAVAAASLLALYREQRERVQVGELRAIDFRLLLFVQDEMRRCILQADPLGAFELLVEQSRARGRPRTPHRDFVIAGDVAEKVEGGISIEKACEEVSAAACLSPEQVQRIYFAEKKADEPALRIDLIRRKAERDQ